MGLSFIPFSEIRNHEGVVVVDSSHPAATLTLSHWRGAPSPAEVHADTSTEIVLKALHQGLPQLAGVQFVTNNHWDVDGFLGIWSLLNPERALQHQELLTLAAELADFREWQPEQPMAEQALKLVCWFNAQEKVLFYPPFGAPESPAQEAKACVPKYHYFLEAFEKVLLDIESYASAWQPEYEQVIADYGDAEYERWADLRVQVCKASRPLHYYASFANSGATDVVVSCFGEARYEVELKYTTWVDTETRRVYPRVDLQPLAQQLTSLEQHGAIWKADQITDTGPLLRIDVGPLSKKERFDHPFSRPFGRSTISREEFLEVVRQYFATRYAKVSQQKRWTWAEIREANQRLKAGLRG